MKKQIEADCGLLPGEKPTPLQIRQCKEAIKTRDTAPRTLNAQSSKQPTIKVSQTKPVIFGDQSKLIASSSKPPVKPKEHIDDENPPVEGESKEVVYVSP